MASPGCCQGPAAPKLEKTRAKAAGTEVEVQLQLVSIRSVAPAWATVVKRTEAPAPFVCPVTPLPQSRAPDWPHRKSSCCPFSHAQCRRAGPLVGIANPVISGAGSAARPRLLIAGCLPSPLGVQRAQVPRPQPGRRAPAGALVTAARTPPAGCGSCSAARPARMKSSRPRADRHIPRRRRGARELPAAGRGARPQPPAAAAPPGFGVISY